MDRAEDKSKAFIEYSIRQFKVTFCFCGIVTLCFCEIVFFLRENENMANGHLYLNTSLVELY